MKRKTAKFFEFSLLLFPFLSLLSIPLHSSALTITFCTFTYHFYERMLSGVLSSLIRVKGSSPLFIVREWEMKLYKALRVKEWKSYAPTYKPEAFEVKNLETLKKAMLSSELCHILCFIFSYLPPILSLFIPYLNSSFLVFFLTSFFSSLFDFSLIIIQRFNRKRVERISMLHHIVQ